MTNSEAEVKIVVAGRQRVCSEGETWREKEQQERIRTGDYQGQATQLQSKRWRKRESKIYRSMKRKKARGKGRQKNLR